MPGNDEGIAAMVFPGTPIHPGKYFAIYFPPRTDFFHRMTARPLDPERRRLVSTAAVLVLLLAVAMAAGCSNGIKEQVPDKENVTIPLTNVIPTIKPMTALQLYRQNLTFPQNKIPENVLQIIDPDFPELDIPRERVRSDRIASHLLITAEDAKRRFNTTIINGQPVGDQVFLTIFVYPNASTYVLDPFVTEVENRKEEFHGIDAWIDVDNVERIAALDQVRGMQLANVIGHSNAEGNAPIVMQPLATTDTIPV